MSETSQITNVRTLMIEDSEDDLILMERSLARYASRHPLVGFSISKSLNTGDDLIRLLKEPQDVIVTDYVMPGNLSWPDVFYKVREYTLAPVIVISGKKTDDAGMAAIEIGAHDYVSKDNMDRLGHSIQQAYFMILARNSQITEANNLIRAAKKGTGPLHSP